MSFVLLALHQMIRYREDAQLMTTSRNPLHVARRGPERFQVDDVSRNFPFFTKPCAASQKNGYKEDLSLDWQGHD